MCIPLVLQSAEWLKVNHIRHSFKTDEQENNQYSSADYTQYKVFNRCIKILLHVREYLEVRSLHRQENRAVDRNHTIRFQCTMACCKKSVLSQKRVCFYKKK